MASNDTTKTTPTAPAATDEPARTPAARKPAAKRTTSAAKLPCGA